jgi:hypothetical protein
MEMANINGKMVVYMLASLRKVKNMGKANGGKFKTYKIVITMMANTKMIKRMVTEFLLGIVEIFTKEIIKTMKEMAMERCFGQMVLSIKVNGKRVFSMEWVKCFFLMEASKRVNLKIISSSVIIINHHHKLFKMNFTGNNHLAPMKLEVLCKEIHL